MPAAHRAACRWPVLCPCGFCCAEMMAALRTQLLEHSNLRAQPNEPLEAVLGVPANANSNQRFLTEEAAQSAGFTVLGLMNEPSAAAIEYAYRNSAERRSRVGSGLLVYDMGGGTFDVSLVTLGENEHTVETSDGIPNLGGDDFDQILADLALETAGHDAELTSAERHHLLEECREKKESLNPNTRKVTIDLERVRAGLVAGHDPRGRVLRAVPSADRIDARGRGEFALALIPACPWIRFTSPVADRNCRRWRAFCARLSAARCAARLTCDRQARWAWRFARPPRPTACASSSIRISASGAKADSGGNIVFDLIFPRGSRLPRPGEPALSSERVYHPAHNVGHFRYLECSKLDERGQPLGEITNWEQIRFPFDPQLQSDLGSVRVSGAAAERPEQSHCPREVHLRCERQSAGENLGRSYWLHAQVRNRAIGAERIS